MDGDDEAGKAFDAWAIGVLEPAYEKLSWDFKKGEGQPEALIR